MKSLKIGFASVIAVLAITLTIAAQAGAFETKKLVPPVDCFIPSSVIQYRANCTGTLLELATTTDCSDALKTAVVNQRIFSGLSAGSVILQGNVPAECGGSADVCCVFLTTDTNPCTNDGQQEIDLGDGLKYYKIASLECKP